MWPMQLTDNYLFNTWNIYTKIRQTKVLVVNEVFNVSPFNLVGWNKILIL